MDYWRPLTVSACNLMPGYSEICTPVGDFLGVGFCMVEHMRRSEGGVESRLCKIADLGDEFSATLDILSYSRSPLIGLSLDRPRIMGILNVTPDSFYDGGQHDRVLRAVEHGLQMVADGADIIDIGGESTRPGAELVSVEEELDRVIPVIESLRQQTTALISIDTRKAEVMTAAIGAGAQIINDVSALTFDASSMEVAAGLNVPVILMHAQGTPQTMQDKPTYDHVVLDVYDYLADRLKAAIQAGIRAENIIIDPGIGFGKSLEHNCALMDRLSLYHGLGAPVLLGCSRKAFIGGLSKGEPASERLAGSLAGVLKGVSQGVQIFRVHDVAETYQALAVWRNFIPSDRAV